jgi:3-phenylpropionate/trans-cinnamate dioxygenase ferredoxin reductase component
MPAGPLVVVGANLTAGAAATTWREEGYDGPIVLIGEEPHPPYERPPLSKEYLRGEVSAESTLLRPREWYEQADIELRLGVRATAIDASARIVRTSDGDDVAYDRLLVATGGRVRTVAVPGADLEGVLSLRTIEQADRIKNRAASSTGVVIVGAGFIGCEVAASLRTMGLEVDVVEMLPAPLSTVLGTEVASVIEAIHRDHGVRFHLGRSISEYGGVDRVEAVVTDRGERIPGDFVVVGVGIEPNVEVVAGTGVALDDGIVVDQRCRTNVDGIFAAGDVANHWHPLFERRLRVEHYDNALKQGAAAARSMLGQDPVFDDPHWFWSDQFGHNLQYIGFAPEWDDLVVRGSLEERSFVAFYLEGGVVRAAAGLDRGRDVRRTGRLIRSRASVDPSKLRDEDVDLRMIAGT